MKTIHLTKLKFFKNRNAQKVRDKQKFYQYKENLLQLKIKLTI